MLNTITVIEDKLRNSTTSNLMKLLVEVDKLIIAQRAIADKSEDFSDVQASNAVKTAILNLLDERDSKIVDDYLYSLQAA
jgi:hypothetical protein